MEESLDTLVLRGKRCGPNKEEERSGKEGGG